MVNLHTIAVMTSKKDGEIDVVTFCIEGPHHPTKAEFIPSKNNACLYRTRDGRIIGVTLQLRNWDGEVQVMKYDRP